MAVFLKKKITYDEDKILNIIWFGLVGLQVLIVMTVAAQAARHYLQYYFQRRRKQMLP